MNHLGQVLLTGKLREKDTQAILCTNAATVSVLHQPDLD